MKREQLEVYSHATNAAIVRMSERQFPGVVVQGDSLYILATLAEQIVSTAKRCANTEVLDSATELHDQLTAYLGHYERVLAEHGVALPYASRGRT